MISKDTFPVYAQYNEDIILAALLAGTDKGFYVDVGANHEAYHSVTKYFYDRDWSGINIEPIPRLVKEIANKRKRDANLQLAISTEQGTMKFREYPEHDGLSTLSNDSMAEQSHKGLPHTDYIIQVETLANVFQDQKVPTIDFLKVDVEGYEFEVLRSNDWAKYRPRVIAIEANHRIADWSKYLQDQGYERVIFDGLNEYYLEHDSRALFEGFAERAALLTHRAVQHHHLDLWNQDVKHMEMLDDMTKRQDALIKQLTNELQAARGELERITPHALLDKPYKEKVKIAAKSLMPMRLKGKLAKQ